MSDLPVVCTLGPGALGARRLGLLTDLLHLAKTHEEIPDGHRLFSTPRRLHLRSSRMPSMRSANAAGSCASTSR